jgi:type I restriction enzyme S subunit
VSWPSVALGDVAAFVRGVTFKPEDVAPPDGREIVACMRTKNVQKQLDTTDVWGIPRSLVKRADQYLMAGDTLVSSANSWNLVGKCCWVPEIEAAATFGGFVCVLRSDQKRIEPRYLFRWFASPRVQQLVRSFGRKTTSIANLDLARCRSLDIPLPPLDEQRRIARVLDAADALRVKRHETLRLIDCARAAVFLEMFGDPAPNPYGWPLEPLGSLSLRFSDGPFGSNLKGSDYVDEGVRVIRLQNIGVGEFDGTDAAYVSPDHFARLSKHECLPGDVLIATLGDPNLRACQLPESVLKAVNKADCVQMRVDERIATPQYVVGLINQPGLLSRALSLTTGQTRTRISMGRLRSLRVPVPPIETQVLYTLAIARLNATEAILLRHSAHLDALFESLQQRAFAGSL